MDISKTWFYIGRFRNGSDGYITANYDFQIEWGDGSKIDFYKNTDAVDVIHNNVNIGKYIPVKHTFAKKGVYKVTLTGTCDNLYGHNGNVYQGAKLSHALVNCLWGVQVPKDSYSPLKYGWGSFFGCENLRYVGYGVFHNITNCKEVPHLYDGAVIRRIEPWMLYGGDNLESIEYTFENCQMESIDKDVFKYCNKVTNANHCFHRCTGLLTLPEGLFDPMPKLKRLEQTFKSCTNLEIVPPNLFDKCLEIINCRECFSGGRNGNGDSSYSPNMKIRTPLPALWNRNNITSYLAYAFGCNKSPNYQQALLKGWANKI